MESKNELKIVKLPAILGYSREEIKETNPSLSDSQIDSIFNAAYELQVSFDLNAEKFVSVETLTYYKTPESARGFWKTEGKI